MARLRVPRTRYPRTLENWYAREMTKLIRKWQRDMMAYFNVYIKPEINGGSGLKLDALGDNPNVNPDWFDRIRQAINLMSMTLTTASQNDPKITSLATRFVRSVNAFSYRNVKMQTAIVGIDPISDNPILQNYVKGKIAENVGYIKSVNTNYYDSIKKDILRSITQGGGTTSITDAIVKRTGMATNHAKMIANDQTGTICSQLDSYRSTKAGAEKYVWHSLEDERVRPKHRELDGKTFEYGDPNGGDDGQLPGEAINCRCYATPIF